MDARLLLVLGYSAVMLGLGYYYSRRVRASGDFFVAGRSLGPGLVASTLLASNIGAGSTVGAAGLAYRDGVAAWWWVGSAALGSIVLALWVGPRMWTVAARHDLRTVGDFLELRYDRRVRGTVSVLLWFGSLAILSGQLIALAWIMGVMLETPKWLGCVLGGGLVSVYFAAGGLVSSVRVNVVQLVVKLGGFALALPIALAAAGGLDRVLALPPPSPEYWSVWESGASGWYYLALLGPAFVISPGLLQKIYGARDVRAVRAGVGWNAVGLLAFAALPVMVGLIARARFPELSSHELALPTLFMEGVPFAVGTIGLAAVFSAELSAADAVLFMLTTSLSQDLYKRFLAPTASDQSMLYVSRATALVAGALSTAFAIVAPSVIDTLSIFYTLMGVSLFVPIIAGLWTTRADATDALVSIVCGVVALLGVRAATGGAGIGPLTPPIVGLLAASLAFLASLLRPHALPMPRAVAPDGV